MKKSPLLLIIVPTLALIVWSGLAGGRKPAQAEPARKGQAPPSGDSPGQPLPGLTPEQRLAFAEGEETFAEAEGAEDGLGPVFNGVSCGECHNAGALGGAGFDLTISRVTRIGGLKNGVYSDLPEFGGPVLQARSLREFEPEYAIPGEVIPPQAEYVSHRITTPLFGAGLMEAVPEATLLEIARRPDPDGVHGVPNRVFNPKTGRMEIGRFGWKAQHSSLLLFAGDAYLNEMGVTSTDFPHENLPQGQPIPPGCDRAADPEDHANDAILFANFMRMLAPPAPRPMTARTGEGQRLFTGIRCTACHVPALKTGPHEIAALAFQKVPLFSDLLLHQMGQELADGIQQDTAKGDQFRTAPLWGLRYRKFYLHDGRAVTLNAAIMAHGGEAQKARDRFANLSAQSKAALMEFLNSL